MLTKTTSIISTQHDTVFRSLCENESFSLGKGTGLILAYKRCTMFYVQLVIRMLGLAHLLLKSVKLCTKSINALKKSTVLQFLKSSTLFATKKMSINRHMYILVSV